VLDEYFTDLDLKRVLCNLLGYFGAVPAWTPASKVVASSFGYFLYGGYHALHTPQYFAESLARYITERNGKVLSTTYVDEILVNSAGVAGVRVAKKTYKAPIVISNVNAKTTYLDLIDRKFLTPEFRSFIQQLPVGSSSITLHLAVPEKLSNYPALIHDKDNQTYLTISSQDDSTLAPQGQSAVVLRTVARFADFFGLSKDEETALIKKRVDTLLVQGKALIPELANGKVVKVMTPLSYGKLANLPQGALSWGEASKAKKPYFKSPIVGLYLSSASVEGSGVEFVIRNGILCAQDIMGWKTN
jgi:all-trans-retinol 13,14-reductase